MKLIMKLSIKKWLSIATTSLSLFLISCGGGGGNIVADGGISGTGISMGRITNFGSIVVNGIQFDVNNASFIRDGVIATGGQQDFSVGEFVVLKRTIDTNGTTGSASEVNFTDLLEGSVTVASADGVTIEVLNQIINTNSLTVLIGFNTLNTLNVGNIVEVSGVKDSNDLITASSIRLKAISFIANVSENEVKGTISTVDTVSAIFTIGNITVEYANARLQGFNGLAPQIGQFVEVKSNQDIINTTLIASRVELEDKYQNLEANTEAEIEGLVTAFTSSTTFAVNGLAVTTTNATEYDNGVASDIAINVLIEAEGRVNAFGVLIAEEISFKRGSGRDSDNGLIELKGLLQSINLAANELQLQGQTIVINSATLMVDESNQGRSSLRLTDLSVGDTLEVDGVIQSNGKIIAIKLEREEPDDDDDDDDDDD